MKPNTHSSDESGVGPSSFQPVQSAAESGQAEFQFRLAAMYESGIGTRRCVHNAAYWYRKAASQNHLSAAMRLIDMIELGVVKASKSGELLSLYLIGAREGSPRAIAVVALRKLTGDGLEIDEIGAIDELKTAVALGITQLNLRSNLYQIAFAIARNEFSDESLFKFPILKERPSPDSAYPTFYHWLVRLGVAKDIPKSAWPHWSAPES